MSAVSRAAPLAAAALTLAAAGTPARAHLVGIEFGAFYAGGLHVFTGLDYVAGLLGAALLLALQGPERARWGLLILPVALFAGVCAAIMFPLSAVVAGAAVALAATGLGALAATGVGLSSPVLAALAAVAGLALGHANGLALAEDQSTADPQLFAAGVGVLAGGAVILAAAATRRLGGLAPAGVGDLGVRVLAGWITGIGLILLALLSLN